MVKEMTSNILFNRAVRNYATHSFGLRVISNGAPVLRRERTRAKEENVKNKTS